LQRAGISLYQDILPLEVSPATEFAKERWRERIAPRLGKPVGCRGVNEGNPVNFSALLRMSGAHRGNNQQTQNQNKIPSPHLVTSSVTDAGVRSKAKSYSSLPLDRRAKLH
jgi:hypothetical protein